MENNDTIVNEALTSYEQEKITGNYGYLDSLLIMPYEEMKDLLDDKTENIYKSIHFVLNLFKMKAKRLSNTKIMTNSQDVFEYLYYSIVPETLYYEEFWALYLNRANKVLKLEKISQGGYNGTVADPKLILGKALQYKASGVIACHNHPSGNKTPSDADIKITRKIESALELMDIAFLDHVILAGNTYYSFKDEGVM